MNAFNRRRRRILRDYILGWTLSFFFLSVVRGVGTEEQGNLQFSFQASLLISFTMGPIIGLISGLAQILIEERFYKRISIGRLLLLRFLYAIVFTIVLIVIAYTIYQLYFGTDLDIITFAIDRGSFAIYFYVLSIDFLLNVLHQINMMLGEGNLSKLIRGRFYHPREEQRIFMFLDLQSSTQIAENLGHLKYSALIQDCFNDLGVVAEQGAEIYQYVGDEAVLTWPLAQGIKKNNCLRAFFKFRRQLQKRAKHYQQTYGIQPFFKAGLHCGTVTVTEIGKYKREIAYHGDPVNTAARIQGQCNIYQKELLISEELKSILNPKKHAYEFLGTIALKGKKEDTSLYAVARSEMPV